MRRIQKNAFAQWIAPISSEATPAVSFSERGESPTEHFLCTYPLISSGRLILGPLRCVFSRLRPEDAVKPARNAGRKNSEDSGCMPLDRIKTKAGHWQPEKPEVHGRIETTGCSTLKTRQPGVTP